MASLKVILVKSGVNSLKNHKDTLRTLGLRKIGDQVVKDDRPEFRGMIRTVQHLVAVEEVE